jgi:hypothetical protein
VTAELARLTATVQLNCHVTDARHARNMTLCTYLLEMRELYRWENHVPLGMPLPRAEIGAWIARREALWESLADADYGPLTLEGNEVDPWDAEAVNRAISAHGLVYGAGVGRFGKPHFFLARLASREERDGVEILEAGCEYVRDLEAAPAFLQGSRIVLRREAFERWLWLRAEAWEARSEEGAMAAALDAYGYATERTQALERMAQAERETLILHELGELAAGRLLGDDWEQFMSSLEDRRTEITARAVRDLLADTLVTLPTLLDRKAAPSLHFWFATFSGMRQELFPRLTAAHAAWRASGRPTAIAEAVAAGREHWERVARALMQSPDAAGRLAPDPAAIRLA